MSTRSSKKPTIPMQLFSVATDPRNSQLIHWNQAGDRIVMPDLDAFVGSFERLFPQSDLASFWASISRHGIQRVDVGTGIELSHSLMQRGRLDLMATLKSNSSKIRQLGDAAYVDEPDTSADTIDSSTSMPPPDRSRPASITSLDQIKSTKSKRSVEDFQAGVALRLKMLEAENAELVRRLIILEKEHQATREYLWRQHSSQKLRGHRTSGPSCLVHLLTNADFTIASTRLTSDLIGELERAGALPHDLSSVSRRHDGLQLLSDTVWNLAYGDGPTKVQPTQPRPPAQPRSPIQTRSLVQTQPQPHLSSAPTHAQMYNNYAVLTAPKPTHLGPPSPSQLGPPMSTVRGPAVQRPPSSQGSHSRESSVVYGSSYSPTTTLTSFSPAMSMSGFQHSPTLLSNGFQQQPQHEGPFASIPAVSVAPASEDDQTDQMLYVPSPQRMSKRERDADLLNPAADDVDVKRIRM